MFGGEGGRDGTQAYDPATNRWTRLNLKGGGPAERSGGNLAYDAARKVHVLFGTQFGDDPHTWVYDLRKDEWRDAKPKTQPPTKLNDAVLAYDANSEKVVAVVRVADKAEKDEVLAGHLETWLYDAGANEWTRADPKAEPPGFANRTRAAAAVPDRNVILLENCVSNTKGSDVREQQVWTYRVAAAKPRLPAPAGVTLKTTKTGAKLSWQPVAGATGYRVERGTGPTPWQVEMKAAGAPAADATAFADDGLTPGTVSTYAVRATGKGGVVGDWSLRVRTQPALVEDVVVSVAGPKDVKLAWTPPAGDAAVGYHVERAAVEVYSEDEILRQKADTPPLAEPSVGAVKAVGPFVRLTTEPVKEPTYADRSIDLAEPAAIDGEPTLARPLRPDQVDAKGKPYRFGVYAYRVRAVNALHVEGGPSAFALTIPSAPQWLFAREEKESLRLKWAANPEAGVAGYRVYRMDGPKKGSQPVTRLTAEPVPGRKYADEKAGKETARYWVVAVDALGQEGFPSLPVWRWRQYREWYAPFAGDWHQ